MSENRKKKEVDIGISKKEIKELLKKKYPDDKIVVNEVHVVGSFNNWGGSKLVPKHISPNNESKMSLDDGNSYRWVHKIPIGLNSLKFAVPYGPPDSAGFVACKWLDCPYPKHGPFMCDREHNNNWVIYVEQ